MLAEVDPGLSPPASVRRTGVPPWARAIVEERLAAAVQDSVAELSGQVGEGTVAVIAPEGTLLPARLRTDDGRPVAVLTPHAAKGLEFDAVLLCEPHRMLDGSRRGAAGAVRGADQSHSAAGCAAQRAAARRHCPGCARRCRIRSPAEPDPRPVPGLRIPQPRRAFRLVAWPLRCASSLVWTSTRGGW